MPKPILSSCQDLLNTLKDLMPTVYQQETLESIPAFLTQNAIAINRKLTASMFDPDINSCCQMTVCG